MQSDWKPQDFANMFLKRAVDDMKYGRYWDAEQNAHQAVAILMAEVNTKEPSSQWTKLRGLPNMRQAKQ